VETASPALDLRWWCALGALVLIAGAAGGSTVSGIADIAVVGLSVVNISRGIRAHRPADPLAWWLLMGAVTLSLLASGVAGGYVLLGRGPLPYPSPADVANGLAYLLAAAAGLVFVRHRSRRFDPTSLIDAGVVTGGVAALAWAFVIVPNLQDSSLSSLARGTNVGFDLLSMILVAIVVRLALGPGARNGSWHWLASAVTSALVSDLLLAVWSRSGAGGWLVTMSNALGAWSCVSLAAAALHPAMARLTEPVDEEVAPMSRGRLVTMIASVLVAPVILLVRSDGTSFVFTLGVVGAWAGLCALIVVRMGGLVRARERMARAESIVRQAGSAMVAATARDQIHEAASQAAFELLAAAHDVGRVSIGYIRDDELVLGTGDPAADDPSSPGMAIRSPLLISAVKTGTVSELSGPDGEGLPEVLRAPWVGLFPMVSRGVTQGVLIVCAQRRLPAAMVSGCESVARLSVLALDSAAAAAIRHQKAAERRFEKLFEHSADIVAVLGRDAEPGFVSPSAGHLLGLNPDQAASLNLRSVVHPDDREAYDRLVLGAALVGGKPVELRLGSNDGAWPWFDVVARNLTAVADVGSVVITARQITDRKDAEERLARSERRFRSLVQNSSDIITILDDAGSVTWVSESIRGALGLEPADLVGRSLSSLVEDETRPALRAALRGLDRADVNQTHATVKIRAVNGGVRIFALNLTDRRADNAVGRIVSNARDVTDEKMLEEGLRYQAVHDDLTGLPNRVLLRDRVEKALARRGKNGSLLALLFIDLDDFKTVNDGLGHAVGDDLLRQAAERLRSWCRAGDTAGRLGGDEIAVLIESADSVAEVLRICDRLRMALQAPFEVGLRRLNVAASVGVALANTPEPITPDELLRNADAAMYVAKSRGKNRIEVFEPSMHMQAFNRLELKQDLLGAVARNELCLYYQPLIELATGHTSGYEALLRWRHPTRGLLPPMSFVPLAEEMALIIPIGWWVLENAVLQLQRWRHQGRDVTVAVNLSARQLDAPELLVDLAALLHRTGTPPGCLTIELTESTAVGHEASLRLEEVRALGVQVAADDFGTGEASYASLQHFPFTIVKIDKSLIDGLTLPGRAMAQIRSIVEMAHSSDLVVVAEGVEHAEQAAILLDVGCDFGQGYLFGRPVPPDETSAGGLTPPLGYVAAAG
jgi:diguanylate cyclase (GGDEF)-like protein/PAS domain S-box-containing protein